MENLEQNAILFMEKGEKAFTEKVNEMMRVTMTPGEKAMWINGYLNGLIETKTRVELEESKNIKVEPRMVRENFGNVPPTPPDRIIKLN